MTLIHKGAPVAWGRRRRDWQIGSVADERHARFMARLAGLLRTEPVVHQLPRAGR